ncbi:iron complex outermembrane recepter protein [Hyphomicrobium sp. 1Nfss2.1]|uniref:TonB-dependent siderophore receptor n=1 Tax=Hyphomicrobium sp. 1Nfss2.1 TaxID=3413936 RepID=UPI003C7E506E
MSWRSRRLAAVGYILVAGNAHAQDPAPASTQLDPLVVEGTSKPKPAKTKKAKSAGQAKQAAPSTKQAAAPAKPAPAPVQRDGTSASTRNTYQPADTFSATKTDTPVIETPQAISTVTRKQLDDQNQQTVGGALGYSAGVLASFEQNARYDNIFLRGFGGFSTSGNYVRFLDGMRLPQGQVFGIMSIDPFLLDRIDVLKGPSALLYGQVSPGGLVNMVSRAPTPEPYNELRFEMGSYGRVQAGYTTQGAFDKEGTLQYSLTAIGKDSGTRYDDVDEQRFAIAPAIAWQPSADTRLTLSGFYQADPEGGYFNSLYAKSLAAPQFQPYLNSKFNPGDPSYDHFDRKEAGIGYQFEHRFNSAVLFRSALRYAEFDLDFAGIQIYTGPSVTGDISRLAAKSIEEASNVTTDNQLQFDFSTGALRHRVLTGIDTQRADSSALFEANFTVTPINVIDPQYGSPVSGSFLSFTSGDQSLDQTGIYTQDQIALGNWRALVGVRHDWTEQVTEPTGGAVQSQDSEATTYRAGLLYLFDNGIAPYASYSTSFEPETGVDESTNKALIPSKGEQYEVGIKYQPTFIPMLFTFSAFDITQQNVKKAGTLSGLYTQIGEISSRGLEFEARGNVTEGLGLIAALTLLDTEVTKSTTVSSIGKRPQAAPEYFGSVWVNYGFRFGTLDGLTLGAGVRVVGSSFADDANTLKADGYTLVDAALSYDLGKLDPYLTGSEATLNVWNLADKEYYSSCSSGFYCEFGERRTFLAGIRHRW